MIQVSSNRIQIKPSKILLALSFLTRVSEFLDYRSTSLDHSRNLYMCRQVKMALTSSLLLYLSLETQGRKITAFTFGPSCISTEGRILNDEDTALCRVSLIARGSRGGFLDISAASEGTEWTLSNRGAENLSMSDSTLRHSARASRMAARCRV